MLPRSLKPFMASNSSVRHGTCFHRRHSAHRAGAAPHSAVAELGVVRRRGGVTEEVAGNSFWFAQLDSNAGAPRNSHRPERFFATFSGSRCLNQQMIIPLRCGFFEIVLVGSHDPVTY